TLVVENLAVKNMVKNHYLALSISDAGWGEFVRQLEYKCDWYGKNLIRIDRFSPSSKTCSGCGYVLDELELSVRVWTCPRCSEIHDRDINAAKNIRKMGLQTGCGTSKEPGEQRRLRPAKKRESIPVPTSI
ncbi:MAG TPA: RNA-guided endonuclease TnpB family protein, partial [Chitinophagaceae bacterium]|nr:RNA-guided endonuclease TnpB family protein [Chitinophagaceae bacterium]